jgi:hypothetical protein
MSGRRIWLSLLMIFVVSSVIAVAVPWIRGGGLGGADSAPTARPSVYAVLLHCSGDVCDRLIEDLIRRTPLTDAERTTAQHSVPAIAQLLSQENELHCPTAGDACVVRYLPADPDQVREALAAAGHPDAIVRVARANDPAPTGAVVFAVPIGPACLLGYHAPDTGPSDVRVEGQLPEGVCLPR